MILANDRFEVRLARTQADVRAAQRLRYRVFVEELGGDGPLVDHENRLERDAFDVVCDHLLLVDRYAPVEGVIGVYRLLPGERIGQGGVSHFYSESEFDLSALRSTGRRLLELGRSCVHPDHRGGVVMHRLWTGLAAYVLERRIDILFGVASFHGTDIGVHQHALGYLRHAHLAPPDLRPVAQPGCVTVPFTDLSAEGRLRAMQAMPALIKAYLRLGGYVGEGVYVDRVFNTIDVCLVMDTALLPERQRRYYVSHAEGVA